MSRDYDLLSALFDANQNCAGKEAEVKAAKASLKSAEADRELLIRNIDKHVNKKRGNPLGLELDLGDVKRADEDRVSAAAKPAKSPDDELEKRRADKKKGDKTKK